MKKENKILEAAAEKRKRGRPSIDIGVTSCLGGTRRTQVNAKYIFEAVSLCQDLQLDAGFGHHNAGGLPCNAGGAAAGG